MNFEKPIIIAVDDEESAQIIFKASLKKEIRSGLFQLFFFTSANDCLKFLEKNFQEVKILLILSDINMPHMDGLTMTEIIKDKFPKINIYMTSAYDNDVYKYKAQKAGAIGYFTKPLDFKKIKNVILESINK